jgi:uncharacterized protein (DUF58 family)
VPDVIARLDVTLRRRALGALPGDHRSGGLGDGTELAQLRPYEPGDDVRRLDPAASARTGIPHVRLQVPERAVTTWLVLDVSASMAFGTRERLKSDVAEGVAEVVARLAVRRGGRIALVTAGEAKPRMAPPRGGRGALAGVRAFVEAGVVADHDGSSRRGAEPAVTRPERPGLAIALDRVARMARSRGLVVVVSDFRDERWQPALHAVGARHTVLAAEVVDPSEAALPDGGRLALLDPETGELADVDTGSPALRAAYAAAEADRRAAVAAALRGIGAIHVELSTERDWLRDLGAGFARATAVPLAPGAA